MTPRWARRDEFDPLTHSPAKTLSGRPAHWAAVVVQESPDSLRAQELVMLGEPRSGHEGLGEALSVTPHFFETHLPDSTWVWRREGGMVILLRHGLPYARLAEADCPGLTSASEDTPAA